MASFNGSYIVVAVMISFTLLVKTSICSEIAEGPSVDISYAPRPLSSYEKYLSDCASKLKPGCGKLIFESVFFGNTTVTNDCCVSLVYDEGKACHLDMTKYAVELPVFKKYKTQILERCVKVWNTCSTIHID